MTASRRLGRVGNFRAVQTTELNEAKKREQSRQRPQGTRISALPTATI